MSTKLKNKAKFDSSHATTALKPEHLLASKILKFFDEALNPVFYRNVSINVNYIVTLSHKTISGSRLSCLFFESKELPDKDSIRGYRKLTRFIFSFDYVSWNQYVLAYELK